MYEVRDDRFATPRGNSVRMLYRADTNDWNVLTSCLTEDEYRLKDLHLSGKALDIGAHIGGVTLALLADNRDLRVVSVEAVPPNVDLLRQNVERNGFAERCEIIQAAAGRGKTAIVRWNFTGSYAAEHNAFIGNSVGEWTREHSNLEVPVRTLISLVGDGADFLKVDCEGCEYDFLRGKALAKVALIRGEYHSITNGLQRQLEPTHDVTFGTMIPGPFEAVLRG